MPIVNKRRTTYGIEGESTLSRLVLSDGFDITSGQAIIKTKFDSFTPETGSLVVQGGGLGVSKNVYIGNELHVLCKNNGVIQLGSYYDTFPSTIQINSHISTDLLPKTDSLNSIGNDSLRWNNLSVNQISNPAGISIFSESTDDSVGVNINKLFLSGPFNILDDAIFQKDVTIHGHTTMNSVNITTDTGDVVISGPGNVHVDAGEFDTHCNSLTLNVTDTVKGVSIATENPGVPFYFGNETSTCTFNGNLVLVRGDLEVQGGTTVIQSQTVTIADKNIVLGVPDNGSTPTDITANGGGLTLEGDTSKYIAWFNPTDSVHPNAWGFSDNIDINPGKFMRSDIIKARTAADGLSICDDASTVLTIKSGKVGLQTASPSISLQVLGEDAIQIPVGSTPQRPDSSIAEFGMIRYSTDYHRFEGFTEGNVWNSLAGCLSIDQQTFITVMADDNLTNNDQIRFFTSGTQVAAFDDKGRLGINQINPVVSLQIEAIDAMRIPVGSVSERPDHSIVGTGMIRFNTDFHWYEGYTDSGVWNPLNGIRSLDGLTYITMLDDDNVTNDAKIRFVSDGIERAVIDSHGNVGFGTTNPVVKLDINGQDAVKIAVGSTQARPDDTIVTQGMIRYNTDLHRFEGFGAGDVWVALGGVVDIEQTTFISVLSDDATMDVHRIRFFTDGNEVAVLDSEGRLGVGDLIPAATLSVAGNAIIGSDYCGNPSLIPPENGMMIQSCLGVALPAYLPLINTVDIAGNICLGADYAGTYNAPDNGLIIQGNTGIGTPGPKSTLDIAGSLTIGNSYAGTFSAPVDGLIVAGYVGIATNNPAVTLDIIGSDAIRIPIGSTASRPDNSDYGMIRYNTMRNRYEGIALTGSLNNGQQSWMSLNSVCNDTGTTFISTHDPEYGISMDEIWFYTSATFDDDTGAAGVAMRVDSHGNVGIGGQPTRALGSIFDINSTQTEQVTIRYDDLNYATFWTGPNGDFRIKNYSSDGIIYGDINLVPAGGDRKVLIGDSTDVYDPSNIPIKLSVLGYIYTSEGIRFPDSSLQTTSATQDSSGNAFGQWFLGDLTAGAKKMWQPIDTTYVAIGTDLPTSKLTVASASGDDPTMNLLELRYSLQKYATFNVDNSGTLNITSGLGQESDILLNPTGNVGVSVDSAAASLHINYDLLLQKNNSPDNTTTTDGLYLRYQSYQNSTPEHGLIASGNNSTASQAPLYISASQLLINPVPDYVGISTTTPQSQLSVGGNVSIGLDYAADYQAPQNGLIVQGCTAIGTFSTSASLEAYSSTQNISIKATQKDQSSFGLVIGNATSSSVSSDGLRVWGNNIGAYFLESFANGLPRSLNIQSSGGAASFGDSITDAQVTITQSSSITSQPVLSLHQSNQSASFAKFTGTAIAGNITKNIVINDANITAATIQGYVKIDISDSGGLFPSNKPLYFPVYTLN